MGAAGRVHVRGGVVNKPESEHRHDWECWWSENVDVCRSCEKEQRCWHKSNRKAEREAAAAIKAAS